MFYITPDQHISFDKKKNKLNIVKDKQECKHQIKIQIKCRRVIAIYNIHVKTFEDTLRV